MTDGEIGGPLPGLGATALQAGNHLGETIGRLLEGKAPECRMIFSSISEFRLNRLIPQRRFSRSFTRPTSASK
jgi:hypothetical protein